MTRTPTRSARRTASTFSPCSFLTGANPNTAAAASSASTPASPLTPPSPHTRDIQAHAARCLRFLYSVERNRKVFKRLFTPLPDLFALFIDIGHYVHPIEPYERLVDAYNDLPPPSKKAMRDALDEYKQAGAVVGGGVGSAQAPLVIRGYQVQEVLGKGAFGTVYQVQKENSDKLYAMKELSLKELQKNQIAGASSAAGGAPADKGEAMKQSALELNKEVEILSQLDHPNIVRYYTSFQEGSCVYILMELVEGTSLLDHINSWVEKGIQMSEESIWPIFIQLCLALCYMHMEKRVVHRDLTPANIMINEGKRVKITDFGLARQTHNGTVLQSAVGTISFSCPEIVMHESYTDKADLWSLGCLLYQMATGKPAFAGSNPLTVAQKIVSGSYAPIPGNYSPLFHEMVRRLLTVDPHARPDILAVSSLISPLLMAELDRVTIGHERLTQRLAQEQEKHRREKEEWQRERQMYRKFIAAQNQAAYFNSASSPVPFLPRSAAASGFPGASSDEYSAAHAASPSPEDYRGPSPASSLLPSSSPPLFRVSTSQLRPVLGTASDPLSLLLSQLHKLIYITQLPPKPTRDLKRTVINKYKLGLFNRPFLLSDFKRELMSLASCAHDFVDPSFELPHLDASTLLTSPTTTLAQQGGSALSAASSASSASGSSSAASSSSFSRLTHEELQMMMEQVLEECGYYTMQAQAHSQFAESHLGTSHAASSTASAATHSNASSAATTPAALHPNHASAAPSPSPEPVPHTATANRKKSRAE